MFDYSLEFLTITASETLAKNDAINWKMPVPEWKATIQIPTSADYRNVTTSSIFTISQQLNQHSRWWSRIPTHLALNFYIERKKSRQLWIALHNDISPRLPRNSVRSEQKSGLFHPQPSSTLSRVQWSVKSMEFQPSVLLRRLHLHLRFIGEIQTPFISLLSCWAKQITPTKRSMFFSLIVFLRRNLGTPSGALW